MPVTDTRSKLDALGAFDQPVGGGENAPFVLTEMEKQSALWKRLKAHFEARIARHRASNDSPKSDEKTALLRGRIREAKYFASLENTATAMALDKED